MGDVYAEYIGRGFIVGIPDRDLSKEEYAALAPELQAALQASGLYKVYDGSVTTDFTTGKTTKNVKEVSK